MTLPESLKEGKVHFAAVLVLLAACYWTIVPSMVSQWYHDPNYSHCFLVPVIAGYFVYERREKLVAATVSPWNPGIVVVLLGVLQLALGVLACENFTARLSLVVLLAGLVLFFFGRELFRLLVAPIGYLALMAPLPYIVYDAAAFPLKLFVSRASVGFLKMIGIAVISEGNIIIFPSITLEVADACSGIRSLVSLLALSIACALIVETTAARRSVIVMATFPIAVVTNALRVIITGILAQHFGSAAAEGFFHEFAGAMVFAVAMAVLLALAALLKRKPGTEPGRPGGRS